MAGIERFEDIEAWQVARKLAKTLHDYTFRGTLAKNFALRDQINRAAISIMANIAEGFERRSDKEFRQFLYIAKASAGEVRALMYHILDCGYITGKEHSQLYEEIDKVSRKIANFIKYLNKNNDV